MAEEERIASALFHGAEVAVLPSDALTGYEVQEIAHIVVSNGGIHRPLRPSDMHVEDLNAVTHIVSTTIDFPQYNQAIEMGVSVVKPSWVYQSQKKGKIATPRQHSPDPSQYFQDVVLSCADLPEGDKDCIIAGVIALGGQYSGSLSKLVTHIVTLNYDHPACEIAVSKKINCRIVLPHWFDDCLQLGKKINERPYMFPNPPFLQHALPRPGNSDAPHVEGATGAMPTVTLPDTPPSSPSDSRKNLNAFMSRRVKLSADLKLGEHLAKTLEGLINHGGGTITDSVDDADIYVCQYRDGADYVAASRARKEVANLSWLYHVINENKYTNPQGKLLHYPVPRNGIDGFQNMRISISNYNGDARIYLENLIKYCGAEFTKTMKQDNTHLITAHTKSEKYDAAQEWNLNVINHLWIEESYAKSSCQSLSNPKYTHFPASTNLSEVCGQTVLDMKRVEKIFFPPVQASHVESVQSPVAQTKSKSSPRKTMPASSAAIGTPRKSLPISAPTPIVEADAETEGEDDEEEEEEPQTTKTPRVGSSKAALTPVAADADAGEADDAEPQTAKKSRGRSRKSAATPRHLDDEKENESPMLSTGGRAAKLKAIQKGHTDAEDMILFSKEMKRKGGFLHGGRRSSHAEDVSSPVPAETKKGKKRKSDENTYDVTAEGIDLSDGETQDQPAKATKKAKTTPVLPTVRYRMMITGDERWVGNKRQEDADKTKLRALGIELTQDPKGVDILVAPAIKRTRKFVAALASAPLVVDTKYLDHALKQNKLLDNPKLLQDPKTETTYDFKLTDALDRAKTNDHKLLQGWSIFVSKNIPGGFETYKEIITVNGGDAYAYVGRSGLNIPKRRLHDDADAGSESHNKGREKEYDYAYLVSGVGEEEVKWWKAFRATAEKQGLQPRIVRSDWLLNSTMSQQIRWKEEWRLDEEGVLGPRDR